MKISTLVSPLLLSSMALALAACAANSASTPSTTSSPASTPMAGNPTMAAAAPTAAPTAMAANPATSDLAATPASTPVPVTAVAAGGPVDFDMQVKPFLSNYCFQCHGPDRHSGRTRYDTKVGILQRVTPGDPASSVLYARISSPDRGHMPPEGQDQPSADEIAMIKQWITEGAKISDSYPAGDAPAAPAAPAQ